MQEYHLLKVENESGSKTYHLNTSTVIIGRNALSGINIDDEDVMSYHAILRRIHTTGSKNAFILISGAGKVSPFQNSQWLEAQKIRKTLVTGDNFKIGTTRLSYLVAYMTESDYSQHFDAQSIVLKNSPKREFVHQ